MQTNIHRLSKPELEFLKDNCNFTDDESILFTMASKRCSDVQIADKLGVSTSTVTKRKKALLSKINSFLKGIDSVVNVYIDGKPVTKEEMREYKVQIREAGNAIVAKLTKESK
jgi:hypothetical protein